ncbi:type II toxin-antitoxin system VapC family toxin [Luteolibacter sp. LG18]|uniref:type II toxin-antitoxin system VapC family toxin n=1 Tax=Luteolibacter sp. LG18 TaxID=2819286 RepID=UPI002B2C9BE7|nr:ribonuclease VapC [Luteolibacter sp. LG18]
MITALDSSVILDVVMADPVHRDASLAAIQRAHRDGRLVISDFVIAELHPVLGDSLPELLEDWQVEHVPGSRDAALHAGALFTSWLKSGGKRGRIVADFLIAAHAHHHADRLLTRDAGFSRKHFKHLTIVTPANLR